MAAVARVDNAERLVCVDANAARLGLNPGLSLADARARLPALNAVQAEPAEEARLLERLCDWCSRFTPLAALDGRDGLMLDISGVAHLFGGEAALAEDCLKRLAGQGITARAAVAANPRAAWALARFSAEKIAPEALSDKAFAKLFHDLPLAALGLEDKIVADMARAGLRRIGDIALRPRAPITARFGATPMTRLDELRGLERGSIAPRFAAPEFLRRAALRFARRDDRGDRGDPAQARRRSRRACSSGRPGARGAWSSSLHRVDGDVRRIRVGAARPLNEARAIARLFAERLASPQEDAIDAGFGVDLMRLACLAAEPLAPSQVELERAHEAERARALADLIDRLSARLGARAVTRRELVEAHLPEQAEAAAPATLGEARTRGEATLLPPGCDLGVAAEGGRRPRGLDPGAGRMRANEARRRGRSASSSGPSRSRRSPKCPTGRRCASAGGACCTTSPPSRGPSASPPPGGAAPTRRRATISAPRIRKAAASGSTAKASGAARRKGRNGSCTECSEP